MSNSEEKNNAIWIKDLINKHSDQMFGWALHKTSSEEVAKDLVQDTFIAALKAKESFKGNSQIKTWLYSILRNKIVDFYRKKKHQTISLDQALEQQNTSDVQRLFNKKGFWENTDSNPLWQQEKDLADNPEFIQALNNCLDGLNDRWASIVRAKYFLGMEADEICKEFDLSTSNYWQIIHRAKLKLKSCLEANWLKKQY